MIRINFGVTDLPYSHGDLGKSSTGRKRASTTGDVAEILESKYGIMEFFWDNHKGEIVEALSEGLRGSLETLLMGGPAQGSFTGSSEVERLFQHMIDSKEMDFKAPGVPTKASLGGVSNRFKKRRQLSKQQQRTSRPSFYDTGLYESSFRCWGDER